jgi:RNA polymerase sigma-70 factor (sigma-E family)
VDLQAPTDIAVAMPLPTEGPDEAVTALFTAHYARFVRLATYLVDERDAAEDVVMDAFAALHRRWRWLGSPNDPYHYLQTSVVNGCRSRMRRLRISRHREGPAQVEPVPSAESAAMTRFQHRRLLDHTRSLPARQRQVIVCRFFLDMTEKQIATQLGISAGSVKKHSARAVATLARRMKEEDQ